jgi:predicted ester cyclase
MKSKEVVDQVITALENQKWEEADRYLTDDFTFSGATPTPVGKKEWLNIHKTLETGLPDFKFNLHDVKENGNKVSGKVQITGTHSHEIPGKIPGLIEKNIAATGRKVTMPEEECEFEVTNGKLSRVYVKPTAGGGPKGLLEQIGYN